MGVVLTGTVTASGAGSIGLALGVDAAPPSAPWDMGPDLGYDRPGNDFDCESLQSPKINFPFLLLLLLLLLPSA